MTVPTLTPAPTETPNRYGGDPAAFDPAMQAWLIWEATRAAEDPAFLAWIDATSNTIVSNAASTAAAIASSAANVQSDRVLCEAARVTVTAQSPVTNAASAAASALAAAAYASTAQATNPDSPIRLNPRNITADFTVPSNYNASTAGPITVSPGVGVTVQDGATWSIH